MTQALRTAAQAFVESFQAHVMESRCQPCNLAWQNLREALKAREIPPEISSLAETYRVRIILDCEHCENNEGAHAGRDIFLGKFDDDELRIVAFFHELGHVLGHDQCKARGESLCRLSNEGLAWEIGLDMAARSGYSWATDYDSKQLKYARQRFATYFRDHVETLGDAGRISD